MEYHLKTLEKLDPLTDEIALYQKNQLSTHEDAMKLSYFAQLGATRTSGARVLAHWSTEEIGASGWKTGMHFIPYYRYMYFIVISCYVNVLIFIQSIVAVRWFAATLKKPKWVKHVLRLNIVSLDCCWAFFFTQSEYY